MKSEAGHFIVETVELRAAFAASYNEREVEVGKRQKGGDVYIEGVTHAYWE